MHSTEIVVAGGFRTRGGAVRQAGSAPDRGRRAGRLRLLTVLLRGREPWAGSGDGVVAPPRRELPTPFC